LHLGSLYAAAASYLDARGHGGRWLVRIEDLDRPREVAGAADRILRTLEAFGFEWDGEIVRQSGHIDRYSQALRSLQERNLTFECSCSRMQLEDEVRYPGTCRARASGLQGPASTRLRIDPGAIQFSDRIQGIYRQDVAAAVGDVILERRDGVFAYLLAVVVDDAAQGITDVVRGADLLDNTPRQIYLQRSLGLPLPSYAHVPVLTEANDAKLAKSRRSVSVNSSSPLPLLLRVFSLLGMDPPASIWDATPGEAWAWAIGRWDVGRVPKRLNVRVTD
jgi:glutamyl-Q tRNA(Asp) synthetase